MEFALCSRTFPPNRMTGIAAVTMTLFHAFTGVDTTFSFKVKGKQSCFTLMHEEPSLIFASNVICAFRLVFFVIVVLEPNFCFVAVALNPIFGKICVEFSMTYN